MPLPLRAGHLLAKLRETFFHANSAKVNVVFIPNPDSFVEALHLRLVTHSRPVQIRPQSPLADLRDSGAIEQDPTIVMFLHEKKADDDGDLDIIIAKNRRGQPWVGLPTRFIASQTRFEDPT